MLLSSHVPFKPTDSTLLNNLRRRNGSYNDNANLSRVFLTSPTAPASSFIALLTLTAFCLTATCAAKDGDYATYPGHYYQSIRGAGTILFAITFGLLVVAHILQAVAYRLRPTLGTTRGREVCVVPASPTPTNIYPPSSSFSFPSSSLSLQFA